MSGELVQQFMAVQEAKRRKTAAAEECERKAYAGLRATSKAAAPLPLTAPTSETVMAALGNCFHGDTDSVIFIKIKDEYLQGLLSEDTEVDLETVQACEYLKSAVFHRTKQIWNNAKVWKKLVTSENDECLYVFKAWAEKGGKKNQTAWYIANQIFEDEKTLQREMSRPEGESNLFVAAFAYGSDEEFPDAAWHLPYWQGKANKAISCCSLWDSHLDLIEENELLKSQIQQLTMIHDQVDDGRVGADDNHGGEADDHHGGSQHGGAGKGPGVRGAGRGGWMPKMGRLVGAVFQENWRSVQNQAKEYYEGSVALKNIVDRGAGKGKSWQSWNHGKSKNRSAGSSDRYEVDHDEDL
jgi:hypothetical protein